MNKGNITSRFRQLKFRSTNHHCYSSLSSYNDHEKLISQIQSSKQTPQTAQIHCLMLKNGIDSNPFPLSKLLAQVSTQDINYAASIFKHIKNPNLYMFNTMLRGYSVSDDPKTGLSLFNCMRDRDFLLDQFSFISLLKCYSRLLAVRIGFGVHTIVLKSGFDLFLNVNNALLNFYCVCGRIKEAHQMFDELGEQRDLVSWNTLMGGYLGMTRHDSVINLFMELYMDCSTVSVTSILNVLLAVGEVKNLSLGECLHVFCVKAGFLSNLKVVSVFMSMYAKSGCISSAHRIFDETDVQKDVVLWNCLIDGYAKSGQLEKAIELLRSMKHDGIQPNSSTFVGLLSACSTSGPALAIGQYVNDYMKEHKLELGVVLGTCLVDKYSKSGLLEKAIDVFDRMEPKDVKSWTAMISGYGTHGLANHAIMLFRKMEKEEFSPNEVTFLALLNSCSHGGLVEEGMSCFRKMVEVYKLKPKIEHYGCMIDLLGRAGLLDDAYGLIKGLPVEGDATAWRALLGACRIYGNVELAKRVKQELQQVHDKHPADSLTLYSTYAVAGIVPHRRTTKEMAIDSLKEMDNECFEKKEAGCSSIEYL